MLELLVTIGIIGILAAGAVPSYTAMQRRSALNNAAQDLTDMLRTAQTRALTSQANANHAVECLQGQDRCSLVTLSSPSASQGRSFSGGVVVRSINTTVIFDRLTGRCSSCGAGQLVSVGYPSGAQKTVEISASGKVSIQ